MRDHNSMTHLFAQIKRSSMRGFVLPFTLLICSIILSVATSVSVILAKELYFSQLSRASQLAYYAADNGMMCALMVDDEYTNPTTGFGIFQYASSPTPQDTLTLVRPDLSLYGSATSIKCATSEMFNPAPPTNFTVDTNYVSPNGDTGAVSTFTMKMDLDGTGTNYRCAKITVKKTVSFRQIISQGYTSCPGTGVISVERAIVNTTEVQ
jgi:hypothetical protein